MGPDAETSAPPPAPQSWPSPAPRAERFRFSGRAGELFVIVAVNLLLTVLTLGFYRFWAKTRLRRYLWAHTSFDDEPFEYVGIGKELFLGFLKALVVLIPLFALFAALEFVVFDRPWYERLAIGIPQYGLLYALFFVGRYAARRYQMSRTTWRGIRFEQLGSPWRYCGMALTGLLLTIVTLGLYAPFNAVRLKRYEIEHWRFGSEPFGFEGRGRDLFKPFLVAWLLAIPTLALSFLWYAASAARYYAQATRFQHLSIALPVSGGQLFSLYAGNLALIVVSLGLLYPMTVKRSMNFWCRRMEIGGELDVAAIAQAPRGAKTGEGLAGFFGMADAGV